MNDHSLNNHCLSISPSLSTDLENQNRDGRVISNTEKNNARRVGGFVDFLGVGETVTGYRIKSS
jgi:hypothetical protein